jgi:hypothetical protein
MNYLADFGLSNELNPTQDINQKFAKTIGRDI